MSTAQWKKLLVDALGSNSHLKHSSYFQLATIGTNGRPSNRTVVFRGFEDNTDKILINTDSRSHKIDELKNSPFAEICWYFTDSWEQFRINGEVDVIDASITDPGKCKQREKSWFASSIKSRLQYLTPTPGIPILGGEASEDLQLEASTGPVDTFCLLVLDPEKVDYLNLKSSQRQVFTLMPTTNEEKSWSSERINP